MDRILVADVYRIHDNAIAKVDADLSLKDAIGTLARNPSLRGVFLVDTEFKFVGLMTRVNLLRWAHFNLSGTKDRPEIPVAEIFKIIDAHRAREVATYGHTSYSVRENDTLHVALDKMLDAEEDVIAVLDDEGKVLGDLRLSEVLSYLLSYARQAKRE
jgi:CBS domain-containing protein